MQSMKHFIHLTNNNQLISIHYTIFKTTKKVKLFMRLLDTSNTACVSGLTDSHRGTKK